MRLPPAVIGLLAAFCVVPSAEAARIPTADERAALEQLLRQEVGVSCADALEQSRPLPLVTDDGTWGTAITVCEFTDPPSGAGTSVWTVFAHRSSPTSADWAVVRPSQSSRVPPCTGEDGLFKTVPEPVVRELREQCFEPSSNKGYEPTPMLSVRVFRNLRHEFDDLGPSIDLTSLSNVNGRGLGFFSIDKDGPPLGSGSKPTLKSMRADFGTPRRIGCRARWTRIALTATACGGGRVTKLVLGAPWRLAGDSEAAENLSGPMVQVGDPVALARYLDARLAKLPPNGRLRLPRMRIGTARVTVHVITRSERISAIEIAIRQVS